MWLVYLSEFEDWYTTVPVHSWFYSNGWLRHKKFPVNALLGEICKNTFLSHKLEVNSWWMEKIRYMLDFYYFTSPICWWWLTLVSTNAWGIQFTFSTKDVSDSWSSWSSKTCHCVLKPVCLHSAMTKWILCVFVAEFTWLAKQYLFISVLE